jgi:hypothetical protein
MTATGIENSRPVVRYVCYVMANRSLARRSTNRSSAIAASHQSSSTVSLPYLAGDRTGRIVVVVVVEEEERRINRLCAFA